MLVTSRLLIVLLLCFLTAQAQAHGLVKNRLSTACAAILGATTGTSITHEALDQFPARPETVVLRFEEFQGEARINDFFDRMSVAENSVVELDRAASKGEIQRVIRRPGLFKKFLGSVLSKTFFCHTQIVMGVLSSSFIAYSLILSGVTIHEIWQNNVTLSQSLPILIFTSAMSVAFSQLASPIKLFKAYDTSLRKLNQVWQQFKNGESPRTSLTFSFVSTKTYLRNLLSSTGYFWRWDHHSFERQNMIELASSLVRKSIFRDESKPENMAHIYVDLVLERDSGELIMKVLIRSSPLQLVN